MKHLVEDWMTKHPLKIDTHEDIEKANEIMGSEAIGHILVIDKDQLVGVLSSKDLATAEKVRSRFHGLDCINVKITVGDLMGRNPVTTSGKTSMADAIRSMNSKGFHSLPVLDEYGRLRGILTSTDVIRYALVASQHSESHKSFNNIMSGD